MDKINKRLIIILALGCFAVFNGALIKISSENQNAGYIMLTGLVMNFSAVIGLILYNFSKIRKALS